MISARGTSAFTELLSDCALRPLSYACTELLVRIEAFVWRASINMKHVTDYTEKEQVQTILDCAQACSSRDYLMLRILWRTGVRVSELLSIRPQDLEPHNQVINITKAKGNKQRRVMLDPETFALLSEYISTQNIPEFRPVFTLSSVQV